MRVQAVTASLLTKKVTPRDLFRHIVDGAADCLSADEASLMLVEGEELRVVSARKAAEHVTVRIGRIRSARAWPAGSRASEALLLHEGDDFSASRTSRRRADGSAPRSRCRSTSRDGWSAC
jgi:hypothetical protein